MNWLFQNLRRRLSFAVRNPVYALRSLGRELVFADDLFLARITGVSARGIRAYLREPVNTPDFARHLRAAEDTFRRLALESADLYAKKVLLQYAVVRALSPDRIVETGVANGVSTAHILLALHRNGKGVLHSVEIGNPAFLPQGRAAGWFVPDWLRDRWQLHLGDARQVLPELLNRLPALDIFVHDSLHTYDHMLWEFRTAFPCIRPGGVVLADDALWNSAFSDFADETDSSAAKILRGVGLLRKDA